MKKIDYQKQGVKNRLSGARFELKVRSDLESKGWIVDRWSNNVEGFGDGKTQRNVPALSGTDNLEGSSPSPLIKLIKAKSFMGRSRTNGFPDFIAFKSWMHFDDLKFETFDGSVWGPWNLIGVECKSNGYLDKIEKEKCVWYLENNIFSKILIASKGTKRGEIKYVEFK